MIKKSLPILIVLGLFVTLLSVSATSINDSKNINARNARAACQVKANADRHVALDIARQNLLASSRTKADWIDYKNARKEANFDFKMAKNECKNIRGNSSPTPTPSVTPTPTPSSHTISFEASGTSLNGVYPIVTLNLGSTVLGTWQITDNLQTYQVNTSANINSNNLRVIFTNDGYDPSVGGADRNLKVTRLVLNNRTFHTTDSGVFATGVFNTTTNSCTSGFLQSQWIHCAGYFEFPTITSPTPTP
ncbi:MAG: carbohydrate-binding domain-containing protein [bacterium]|nr:carbohydrate-binding domain-containing protein [bacterium]